MWPSIPGGSLVEITPVAPTTLELNDLVAVERDGAVVVHRLVAVTPDGWVLQGDAKGSPDPPVMANAVLGRAQVIERRPLRWKIPRWRHVVAAGRALRRYVRSRF